MDKVLTPKDIAQGLKLSIKTVDKWLKTGYLKGFKVGRLWRVKEKDLNEFINKDLKDNDNEETIIEPCYNEELSKQCLKDIKEAEEEIKRGEYLTLDEVKKRLNL